MMIMIVFIVLINYHNTAFYTWHDFSSENILTSVFFGTKIMPSIECSIVIIDQYYENNHYHHYNGECVKGSGDFLSALC